MNSGGVKVSIPNSVRKTIQDLKEISGNHTEDEIYAMLKDCSMDPNETAQKLLQQDPFHEVRRKRDRKKENLVKESTESRWKPGMQGRGNRGGRGTYSSRHNFHDAGGSSKKALSGKENKKNKEISAVASSSIVAEKTSAVPVTDINEPEVKTLTAADPILMPSQDSQLPVGTVTRELGSQQTPLEKVNETPAEITTKTAIVPDKEWKPKSTNPITVQGLVTPAISISIPVEAHSSPKAASSIPNPKESHVPDGQHIVIIPNHLHVPEADKLGFCFGSFDASFDLNSNTLSGPNPMTDKAPSISEASEDITEHIEALAAADDGANPDRSLSSSNVPENLSPEGDVSSNVAHEHITSKQETSLPAPGHQYPVVQQPFDPVGYYPQFYRSGGDSDRRVSPFQTPKYNGHVPVLSQQISQSPQEVGNSLMLSSIAVTQQPLPVFRQPTGLHLPHYPPNFIPYGPYFPPIYIAPPAMHHVLSNGAFPQQPPAGGMHPAPPVSTPKYPLQQYKPGSNTTNPGTYPAGYNLNSAGNPTSNEDLGGSQFKESNVYVTGLQSEGSGVWIAAPGRDISGLQATSFYNLPHGGQVAYAPTQAAHATFASIYQPVTTTPIHPLLQQPQTMAAGVDMVGPTSTVYQQPPQPPQINWPNNY